MNAPVMAWLPPPADGDVERALQTFVSAWANTWFASPGEFRAQPFPGRSDATLHWCGNPGSRLGLTAACRLTMGNMLVDGQADIDHLPDQEILLVLADAAAADLTHRLAEAQPLESGANASAFRVTCANQAWSLLLFLGEQTQIALRRAAAGHKNPPRLTSLSEALAPEVVRIGCRIGGATISAGELAELNKGDLIALDSRIDDALQLTIADRPCAKGQAKIIDRGAGVAVQIVEGFALEQL